MTSGGVLSMMNSYPGAAQSYGPPTSPANSRGFPPASSPGALDMYGGQDSMGYVQAASPQPAGFPSIAVSLRSLHFSFGPFKCYETLFFRNFDIHPPPVTLITFKRTSSYRFLGNLTPSHPLLRYVTL